jgi:hypothetical protein
LSLNLVLYGEGDGMGRDGERALGQGHVHGGVGMVGMDGFALGVPATVEGVERGLLTRGVVSCPPVPELLVPALTVWGSADPDVRPPDGGLSLCSHAHLLGF